MNPVRHPRNLIGSFFFIIASFTVATGHSHNDSCQINVALDEIRTLAANIGKETERLTNVEERLKSEMKRLRDEIGKIMPEIQNVRTELTNVEKRLQSEMSERMDSAIGKTKPDFESVRKELGNVGKKLEETILMGIEEAGNRTIDALRRDQELPESQVPHRLLTEQAALNNTETSPLKHRPSVPRLDYLGTVDGATYYVEKDIKRNWTDAKQVCEAPGVNMNLATVLSLTQHDFLLNNLQESYWIGAQEHMGENAFRWEGTQQNPVNYETFYYSTNFHWCLTLKNEEGMQGFGSDACTTLHPTLCQRQ